MILRCVVLPPAGVDDVTGAAALLRVEDVTMADAPARVIASRTVVIGEPVELSLPPRPPGRRWVARAEFRRGHALTAGDLLTTVSVPVHEAATDALVVVPLARI
jgi:hypothetical protein